MNLLSSRPRRGSKPIQMAPESPSYSVIGADIVVTGNIEATVDLHIEGRVDGDVRCATLFLGDSSTIKGNVFAERIRIAGIVQGSVDTKDLAIESTARVTGDVSYERLRVASGGMIEGSITCKATDETSRLKLVEGEIGAA
jgi:cytoskeletal protein CcmA (bactofilin family)